MSYSLCGKCHKIIVIRNYSSTWKIPDNKNKEIHIHKPIDISFTFGFNVRKFKKEVTTEYWKIYENHKTMRSQKIFNTASANVLKKLMPRLGVRK